MRQVAQHTGHRHVFTLDTDIDLHDSMVGALNKLPVAASGMLFFGDPVTPGSVSAVGIGFLAGLLYSVAKNHERKGTDTRLPVVNRIKPFSDIGRD